MYLKVNWHEFSKPKNTLLYDLKCQGLTTGQHNFHIINGFFENFNANLPKIPQENVTPGLFSQTNTSLMKNKFRKFVGDRLRVKAYT